MSCRDVETSPACFTDATGDQRGLVLHTVYESGVVIASYFTEGDGVTVVDTSTGTVAAGACPIAQPDVEWEELCDVLADGTVVPFLRRSVTRFDASGSVIDPVEVADFELDKVTAYTVAGTVRACPECTSTAPLGLITDLTLLNA